MISKKYTAVIIIFYKLLLFIKFYKNVSIKETFVCFATTFIYLTLSHLFLMQFESMDRGSTILRAQQHEI